MENSGKITTFSIFPYYFFLILGDCRSTSESKGSCERLNELEIVEFDHKTPHWNRQIQGNVLLFRDSHRGSAV